MNRFSFLVVCAAVWLGSGCELLGGGGGASGGGGGSTGNTFTKGFTFVRKDDRNVYVADESDFQNTVAQLTTAGGARTPSLSKDARTVVYARTVGSDTELDTVPARGGTVRTVLTSTTVAKNLRLPVFSPDGTHIAFTYDEGSGSAIGLVNADGTGFVKLAGGGSISYVGPSYSADGTKVLAAAGSGAGSLTQLELLDVGTGTPTNVTSTLGTEALVITGRPVLSPDGAAAAFDARLSSGVSRIFVISLSTKQVTRLTDYADATASDSFPSWVGSTKVGFSSDTGGNDNVYELPATASKTSGGLTLPSAIEASYGPN